MPDRKLGEFLEATLQFAYTDQRQLSQRFPDLAPQLCIGPIVPMNQLRDAQTRAAAIRPAIEALGDRTDNDAVIGWSEVIEAMRQEHDPRIADAVAKLRSMNRYQNNYWASAAERTLAYLNDKEGVERLRADLATRRPDSSWGIEAAIARWKAAHPQPTDMSAAGFAQYSREKAGFLRELQLQHPRSTRAAEYYFDAVKFGAAPELTAEEVRGVVDLELRYDRDYPFAIFRRDEIPLQAARAYSAHGVRLDEIPNLAAEEVRRRRVEYELARPFPGSAQIANEQLERAELHADTVLTEYWSRKKDAGQVRIFVDRARAILSELAPPAEATGNVRRQFEREEAPWIETLTSLGIEAQSLAERRAVNWAEAPRVPFPEFSVADLQGRRWNLAAWKGKVIFLNVWGTWCGPCRAELPNVQKLFEETRNSPNLLVLTVNVDEDRELTPKFLRDNHYTFPVIASPEFADLIDRTTGVPQSRFVDGEGRMLKEPADIHCASCAATVRTVMERLAGK